MAKHNKDKNWESPKAPVFTPAPKKEESKSGTPVPAPVSYAGDSIQGKLLWIGVICICLGLTPMAFRYAVSSVKGAWNQAFGGTTVEVAQTKIVICGGLYKPELNGNSSPVRQKIKSECFSGVLVSPSAPKDKIVWHTPGKADVCFWRVNRCVAWMHLGENDIQEAVREGNPDGSGQIQVPDDYTALFFKGDPGEVEVLLSR